MSYMHNDDPETFLTYKQMAVLEVIAKGNGYKDGKFIPCDLDQIIERCVYTVSKQALQFTLRRLIKKEMVVKVKELELRRDRYRVLYVPTEETKVLFRSNLGSYIELSEIEKEFNLD